MVAEPWLDSAQTGGTGWVQPGKAQPCPICSLGWGFIHAWVSPGWVLLLARFWSLWGITCICIPHSLSCISSLSPTSGAEVGGAQPCLSMAVCPGMGTGQAPSWHPRPRGSRCLVPVPLPPPSPAPHVLPEPALGEMSTALPALVPAKWRAQETKSQHHHGPARTTHR